MLSFQGNRQRQIIYRVTSQQDSSVLQVISGPETSVQDEMSVDAMHVFIDEHGKSLELLSNEEEGIRLVAFSCPCGLLASVLDFGTGRLSPAIFSHRMFLT